ncbi:peptidoglycan DD-metalloendopeptidase family protein [Leptobacterium flavescens]|uniref:Peptidoglycan DD-metalloendopeptidase family protein n=1 Tax=Leptobacterium flavescens TaxID=472055 RepID=A0A6P0UMD6_9FLAO|nr:M23 family metallopeptidase [Leptobacterium flavescens]NER14177.1 peptidoglycan DD-metalloendopeptidase family protein [Leptobacterium flavescens]
MRFLAFFFILFTVPTFAQKEYPKDAFRPPLDIPLLLSGTFGELRSNHFHSGIDIKTQQREGLSIFSVGDGYVTRIKVSPWGFGKALYIVHPNGYYTSVYAHLKKFSPEIEAYVKKIQYERESYEVEIFPEPNEFKVSKGDLIAYSGNTGSSGGPHLHFEYRDSAQKPINPMHFGINISDSKAPRVLGLFGYSIDDNAQINQSNVPIEIKLTQQGNGNFLAEKVYAEGKIGFGVNTYDQQDHTYNKNGVYAVEMMLNGQQHFSYDFEKFSFAETRFINAFIDFERYRTEKERVQKLFIAPKNPLSIYETTVNDGILEIEEGQEYTIEIRISDFKGNKSTIRIPVEGKKQEVIEKTETLVTDNFLRASIDNNYEFEGCSVFFPANSFYENFYIDIQKTDSTLNIHHDKIPVHRNFTVSFDTSSYSEEERRKLYIARYDEEDNELVYEDTAKRGDVLSTKTRNLGVYTLATDTISPKVTPINFKGDQWLTNYQYLKVKIEDLETGIANYRATINGKWILMEYEPKKDMLSYDLRDLKSGSEEQNLKVIVTDNVGNSTTFTSKFYLKN